MATYDRYKLYITQDGTNFDTVNLRDSGAVRYDTATSLTDAQKTQTRGNIGLENVDNTRDANKPVSTPQATALALKLDKANVYNGLDKTAEGFALDARQGKALSGRVDDLKSAITQIDTILDVIEPISGVANIERAYENVYPLTGLEIKSGTTYKATFTLDSAISSPVYAFISVSASGTDLASTTITAGNTTGSITYTWFQDYDDVVLKCVSGGLVTIHASFEEVVSQNAVDYLKNITKSVNDLAEYEFDANFINGTLAVGGVWSPMPSRICCANDIKADRDLRLLIDSGYRFDVMLKSGNTYVDSGWITDFYYIKKGSEFKITISKNPDISGTADIATFRHALRVRTYLNDKTQEIDNLPVVANIFRQKRYFSHIGVTQTNNIVIPYLSLWDVARAKRLGFDVLEINVLQTSDNKYVCIHGNGGKFGTQYEGVNGEDVSDTLVSSMTLQGIKETIRFKTKYAKYKTAPCSLEELLQECKRQNIIPLCQYVDSGSVEILNKIMGKNNYILSIYGRDRDNITTAPLASWLNIADVDDLLAKCDKSGGIYMAGLNVTDSAYDSFTDNDWTNLVESIHTAGYFVSFNPIYAGEVKSQKLFNLGFDFGGSGWNINEIENGNLCNLFGETEFTDFATNGTTANNVITLTDGQTVTPNTTLPSVFLGGGSLHIRFSGTITLQFGVGINAQFTSDGESEMWFSTYFEEASPIFTITASGSVSIYEITYKASKM